MKTVRFTSLGQELTTLSVDVIDSQQLKVHNTTDNTTILVTLNQDHTNLYTGTVTINGQQWPYAQHQQENTLWLWVFGNTYSFELPEQTARRKSGGQDGGAGAANKITSPMPGKILQVKKAVGDAVTPNETLVVMESMKMEMSLNAPAAGIIKHIAVQPNDMVAQGAILIELTLTDEGTTE